MSTLVSDCPRCATKRVTFDVLSNVLLRSGTEEMATFSEALCRCRACRRSSVMLMERRRYHYSETAEIDSNAAMWSRDNGLAKHEGPLRNRLKSFRFPNAEPTLPEMPDHLPEAIQKVQAEANACLLSGCWNAAGALYCAALDLATRDAMDRIGFFRMRMRATRDLPRRLKYMFDRNHLPRELQRLSGCVKPSNISEGGVWFSEAEAKDLYDFATELLRRIYTEPTRICLAVKRSERRAGRTL